MATYEKIKFSELTATQNGIFVDDNDPSIVNQVAIHKTSTSATVLDEVWLWIHSPDPTTNVGRFMVGDASNGQMYYTQFVPLGTTLVCPGIIMSGTGSAVKTLTVGWEYPNDTSERVHVFGFVNRITP